MQQSPEEETPCVYVTLVTVVTLATAGYTPCLFGYVTIGLARHNRTHFSQSERLLVKPKRPCTDLCVEPVGVWNRLGLTLCFQFVSAASVWGAVCFRSSSERAVTDVRDGPLRWTFETNGTDSSRRLLQKSTRAGRGVGPWTDGRDGPPGRTFETNGTDSWRRLLQKFVRAGCGRPAVTGRQEGLLE